MRKGQGGGFKIAEGGRGLTEINGDGLRKEREKFDRRGEQWDC